jgi:hypothetical protein
MRLALCGIYWVIAGLVPLLDLRTGVWTSHCSDSTPAANGCTCRGMKLAAYGAAVTALSIGWQVFTWWRKGARLRGCSVTDMIVGCEDRDDNTYIQPDIGGAHGGRDHLRR